MVTSAPLSYSRKGKLKGVKKAEGVDYDPVTDRLYVMSDKEARLYVFQVGP